MEEREDLRSILPFLPVVMRSSSLYWPLKVVEALKAVSRGPIHSRVDSGEVLSLAISDMRESLSLSSHRFASSAAHGYALFFDELMSKEESTKWFSDAIPALAKLLLRLPSLLETHYEKADAILDGGRSGLRLLVPQEAGVVLLSQELIGALLACSFFCLFPVLNRGAKGLPAINFDKLFASIYESYSENQEHKIRCIIHYFERICSSVPMGFVSFERKVLPVESGHAGVHYPSAAYWSQSGISLCAFEVHSTGLIEDKSGEALEVDFANKYLGGGALNRGCVQEEIRFMINPELIAGMLFIPCMDTNEAIEIVGAEKFSCYTGYASSFRFGGNYVDKRSMDSLRRRKRRIVAIDALCRPGLRQFEPEFLLRECNKAFCGFLHTCKYSQDERVMVEKCSDKRQVVEERSPGHSSSDISLKDKGLSSSGDMDEVKPFGKFVEISHQKEGQCGDHEDKVGIATGNWGCGAFGGDPELKTMTQWLAASQAGRPFISYYTFGEKALGNLDQVTKWIIQHEWTVGDLWNMLVQYSLQRLNKETKLGFFSWLIPSQTTHKSESTSS